MEPGGTKGIGVFLRLERGPHDAKLEFPCKAKFTISVVVPGDENKRIEKTVDFATGAANTNGRESNVGLGWVSFLSTAASSEIGVARRPGYHCWQRAFLLP
jgi:hypothetical protein